MVVHNSLTARSAAEVPSPRSLTSLFKGEGALVFTGVLGLLLSGALALYMWITGITFVAPEGHLIKAVQFDLALGLFVLNTAAMLPLVGFRPAMRAFWRYSTVVMALYAYGAETIQVVRGYDPRFSQHITSFAEAVPGILLGIDSMLIVLFYIIMAVALFLNRRSQQPVMVLAMRYGVLSTLASFAGGIWMIALAGSGTGGAGNVMWLHFIGIVGMKTLFVTGWAAGNSGEARRWIHTAGLGWLLADAMVAWQTAQGLSVFSVTPAMAGCLVGLGLWAWSTLRLAGRTQG